MTSIPVEALPHATNYPAPAAFRAIQVLEVLSHHGSPVTLTEVSLEAGLAKSSVLNILVTLEATGMVRRSHGAWVLGYKALEIGQSVLASTDLVSEFRRLVQFQPTLRGDTTLLAVLDGLDVLYLARHDGHQQVRLASDVGRRLPAVVTGLGKAMLAALPEEELERRLSGLRELPRPTRRSHRTVGELRLDLAQVRVRGFALPALGSRFPTVANPPL
jgi:DNA-binding IclR family transcriptional regulator